MKYDYTVFIGRFQPFHSGHLKVVLSALEQSDKLVMVLGSKGAARTTRNPWSVSERIEIIKSEVPAELHDRITFTSVHDHSYNDDRWVAGIQHAVYSSTPHPWQDSPTKIALIGMQKDASSYYLNLFPQWDSIAVPAVNPSNATDIRNGMFAHRIYDGYIPEREFQRLCDEWKFETEYKTKWGNGPHTTVDSIVTQSGHILLIQRGKEYGYEKWALPGGFVNQDETLLDASIRELREETRLKVPIPVLKGSMVQSKVYDLPYRDLRSRNISHAFHYQLTSGVDKLPKVKGSDDAIDARWFSISEFLTMREFMFADHYDLCCDLLRI